MATNKGNKFNIFIGLLKADMSSKVDKSDAISTVANALTSLGILGFNVEDVIGYWEGQREDAIKVSFINTFGVEQQELIKSLETVKESLGQESVLLEEELTSFNFV